MICAVAKTFGQNLKRLRQEHKVTQEELMRRLKLKRQAPISLWETGDIVPRPDTIVRIAEALKADPKDLLDDVETDYDRIRRGLPIRQKAERSPARKIAVGESPPGRPSSVKGRRAPSK